MITVDDIELDDFKSWFSRDFNYATPVGETDPIYDCPKDYVTDADITKAFTEAKMNFNSGLFGLDDELRMCFLYLSAHYLVNDLQTSVAGVGSTGYFAVNSRSVGSVSEGYQIPDWVLNDPILGSFMTTRYGQKYLSLIKPLLIGNVQVYIGNTTPW
jgi:hypothetical protein